MPYNYLAFGLRIATDVPIPGLLAGSDSAPSDIEIELDSPAAIRQADVSDVVLFEHAPDATGCTLRVWSGRDGHTFRFLFGDGTEFVIEDGGSRIRARWRSDVGLDGMSVYLLGPVMGFALRLRGLTCLHGGAVSTEAGGLAILAGAGRGKSTAVAAFGRRGVSVLTDDLLALREGEAAFWAQPAYPRIRLWPHAAKGLFGSEDALPRITPDDPSWDKRFVDLTEKPFRFGPREVPLTAVYVGIQDESAQRPVVEEIGRREAFLTVLSNSYSHRIQGREMLADDFDRLARLLHRVPVRRFRMKQGFEQLDELYDVLLADQSERTRAEV